MIHRNSRKRTRSLPFSPWVKGLILGFSLGAGLQFIPGTEGLFSLFEASPPPTFTTISHQDSKKSIPLSHPILEREGYTVAYDGRTKSPLWVFEELTKESLNGDVDRSQFQFVQDPDIPEILQGDVLDYKGQGFDCGHIAPAADHRSTENGMKETFYLSNISPQTPQFNRGYWKHFEKYVRDLTKEYERVEVVGGLLSCHMLKKERDSSNTKSLEIMMLQSLPTFLK